MKQKTLFKLKDYTSEFGGSLLQKGRRKSRRPISTQQAMKLVLKADTTAKGTSPLSRRRSAIEQLFQTFAETFHVKLYEVAVCGDHIHFVARFTSSTSYTSFIRSLTGTIARKFQIKWRFRPWSRILAWGRAFKTAIQYTIQNHFESVRAIPYQIRPKDRRRTRELLKK